MSPDVLQGEGSPWRPTLPLPSNKTPRSSIPRSKPHLSPLSKQALGGKSPGPTDATKRGRWHASRRSWGLAGGSAISQTPPNPPRRLRAPPGGDSCWPWQAADLFKLEGKQREGSLGRRGGGGAGGRRGGWCVPWPGCGGGLGGKPCTPPCRGSSLLGPEEARSPVLICTYPYTRSCRCKGSTGGLIGH